MSIEFFIHCEQEQPIALSELRDLCLRRGREILFIKVFASSLSDCVTVGTGFLQDADMIVGWDPASPRRQAILDAFSKRDVRAMEQLFEGDTYGTCGVQVSTDPLLEEEASLMRVDFGQDYVTVRKRCKVTYGTRTNASRNDHSLILLAFITDGILELRRGYLEDPQEGDYDAIQQQMPPYLVRQPDVPIRWIPQMPARSAGTGTRTGQDRIQTEKTAGRVRMILLLLLVLAGVVGLLALLGRLLSE